MKQGTPDWYAARAGKITASLAAACLGLDPHKSARAAWREIAGSKVRDNKHMAWGREFESEARRSYEAESGAFVVETGFIVHPELPWLGASPDGLIGTDGLVEIKCPSVLPGSIPVPHQIQMQVQLACTGREWCDYFVYVRPTHFVERLRRNLTGEAELLEALREFYESFVKTGECPPKKARKGATA